LIVFILNALSLIFCKGKKKYLLSIVNYHFFCIFAQFLSKPLNIKQYEEYHT